MPDANDAPNASESSGDEQESVRVRWLASDRAQTLANVLTIIVAVAAIALSIWEGVENRRHNRLSVLPHLERAGLNLNEDSVYTMRFAVENTGLGPAVLQNFLVFHDGEKVFDSAAQPDGYFSYEAIRDDLSKLPFRADAFTNAYTTGELLKAGAEHLLIDLEIALPTGEADSPADWPPNQVRRVIYTRSFVFCYCSVYEEDCDQVHVGAEPPSEDVCDF